MRNGIALGIALLAASGLLVACGGNGNGTTTPSPTTTASTSTTPTNTSTPTPPATTATNPPPANGGNGPAVPAAGGAFGTITGSITYVGDIPEAEEKPINKDNEVCGTGQRAIHWYKSAGGGRLDECVVFLDGDVAGSDWSATQLESNLVQEGCFFKPYIAIWRRGVEVSIESKDVAAHNIHTYERMGTARKELFNFNQPSKDVRTVTIKTRRSQFVELTCDNHDFMAGWRFVAKNPYCLVATGGRYTLRVPLGTHTLKVWHPMAGVMEEQVEVTKGGTTTQDFEFEE